MKEKISVITGYNLNGIVKQANEMGLTRNDFISIVPYACGEFALLYWSHE